MSLLVCDNLNTHTPGAVYEAFPPEVAQELLRRLRYTPKHGSWLNIAENELIAVTRQCMGLDGLIVWKSYVKKFKVGRVTVMLNRKVLIGNLRLIMPGSNSNHFGQIGIYFE
jgi:hypothetical protein